MGASLRRRAGQLARRLGLRSILAASGRAHGAEGRGASLRDRVVREHLRGEGLEIGALHCPVQVAPGVLVKYVDNTTRLDNARRFPDIDPARIINPDLLENGFSLGSVPDASEDFVIANHVLEHGRVALDAMWNWARVLRPGGMLLLTVPLARHCFDADRELTSVEHHVEDFALWRNLELEALTERDRHHYHEWVTISSPVIYKEQGQEYPPPTDEEVRAHVEMLLEQSVEIHFHTFSEAAFAGLLDHFCSELRPDFERLVLEPEGGEVLALLQRRAEGGPSASAAS